MKAKAIFNDNGSVTIETKPNIKFTFYKVSDAVNFCNDYKISAQIKNK